MLCMCKPTSQRRPVIPSGHWHEPPEQGPSPEQVFPAHASQGCTLQLACEMGRTPGQALAACWAPPPFTQAMLLCMLPPAC